MLDTKNILHELLTEELLNPYLYSGALFEEDTLLEACSNFEYIHDLSSFKIEENLTEDFESTGAIEYNVNSREGLFFNVTFNYCDGDLEDIDYVISNRSLFENFIEYTTKVVHDILKEKILKRI